MKVHFFDSTHDAIGGLEARRTVAGGASPEPDTQLAREAAPWRNHLRPGGERPAAEPNIPRAEGVRSGAAATGGASAARAITLRFRPQARRNGWALAVETLPDEDAGSAPPPPS